MPLSGSGYHSPASVHKDDNSRWPVKAAPLRFALWG